MTRPGRIAPLAAALVLAGCMQGRGFTYATTPLLSVTDAAERVRDGATTRVEVLDLLGPPSEVVRAPERAAADDAGTDPRLAAFPPGTPLGPRDLVYRWVERRSALTAFAISYHASRKTATFTVLVDGEAGVVKAHVLEVEPRPRRDSAGPPGDDAGSPRPGGAP